jgi:hypothetical protein
MTWQPSTPAGDPQDWVAPELVDDPVGARHARRQIWFWIVLLLVFGTLGLIVLLAGAAALYLWSAESLEVTPADRQLVVTVDDLAPWLDDVTPDRSAETVQKSRYFDGSWDIEYEYEHPDEDVPLYINSSVTVEHTTQDARTTYASLGVGVRIGLTVSKTEGMQLVDRNDLYRWGDQSRCTLVTVGGRPVGTLFLARKATYVFYFAVTGLALDNGAELGQLLDPHLKRLEAGLPVRP